MNRLCRTVLFSLGFLCLIAYTGAGASLPEAKLTIKVLDDDGLPLSNMPVHLWLSESAIRDGQTDSNGLFVAEGACTIKDIPISIVKQGYYDSKLTYSYPNYMSVKDNKWQPWNPIVTAVVRRVVNPIPMYAKRVETLIPGTDGYYGFDVEAGDWVSPYGQGKREDILFKATRSIRGPMDYAVTVEVCLANCGDGLRVVEPIGGSSFGSPREAPTNDYSTSFAKTLGCKPDMGYFNVEVRPGEYFVFRVRTVYDTKSNVISRCYGKIPTGFGIGGYLAEKIGIHFTYYFNPTPNDRNMEFDPTRNLFHNLKPTEQIARP